MTVLVLVDAPTKADDRRQKLFSSPEAKLLLKALEREDVPYKVASLYPSPIQTKKLGKKDQAKFHDYLPHIAKKHKCQTVILVGAMPFQALTGKGGVTKANARPIEKDGLVYIPCVSPYAATHDPKVGWQLKVVAMRAREVNEFGGIPFEQDLNSIMVKDKKTIEQLLWALVGELSFDIETSCLYPWQTHDDKGNEAPAQIKMIGFGTLKEQFHILTPNHPDCPFTEKEYFDLLEDIDRAITRNQVRLVTHNGKFDFLWIMAHYGFPWYEHQHYDTMLAHYLLDENSRHGLKELAQTLCGAPDWDVDKDTKKGATPDLEKFVRYHAHDLYYTIALKNKLVKMMNAEPRVKAVYDHILLPCSSLFTEAEYDGVYIDVSKFDEAENYLRNELKQCEDRLKQWGSIEWGSPKQLAKLLFEDLGIDPPVMTEKGNPSTSESALNQIDHPCVGDLIKYRGAKQQLSFFIEGWKPFLHRRKINGEWHYFLHPSFKLHGTVTGRLSCEHPNLQQVPRDKRIRSLITAPPGWTLIECDLSQIELRIAAALAEERNMIEAFVRKIDVHWLTAIREIERGGGLKELVIDTAKTWKQLKKIEYSEAIEVLLEMGPDAAAEINAEWKEYRKKAKAINFGYLYGMWWKKFKLYARDNYGVEVTDEQAGASRTAFFELYPDYPEWHKRQKRLARRDGYIETLSGRKRRLPDAMSSFDSPARGAAERQAINSPVQSLANEINLMAALQLRNEYGRDKVRLSATVHDAILACVKNEYVGEVTLRLLKIMERPELMDVLDINLLVPIEAEGKVGPWGAGVSLKKWKESLRVQG